MIWPIWVIQIIIAIVMIAASLLLMPKPQSAQPDQTKDLDAPTADASRPVPVVFGSLTVKSPNVLWYGDIGQNTYQVNA